MSTRCAGWLGAMATTRGWPAKSVIRDGPGWGTSTPLMEGALLLRAVRGLSASRVRVPGGRMDAGLLSTIQDIAQTYGDGTIHLTVRQGFEIPGIPFEAMPVPAK